MLCLEKRLRPILTELRLLKINKVFKELRLHKTKCLRSRDFTRFQEVFKEMKFQATSRAKRLHLTLTKSRLGKDNEFVTFASKVKICIETALIYCNLYLLRNYLKS